MAPSVINPSKPRSERDQHTYVARVQDAAKVISGEAIVWRSGKHQKADPWTEQEKIRLAWRKIATDLRATGEREDLALAGDVDAFVDRMPPIRTQQQEIAAKLLEIRRSRRVVQEVPPTKDVAVHSVQPVTGGRVQAKVDVDRDNTVPDSGRER